MKYDAGMLGLKYDKMPIAYFYSVILAILVIIFLRAIFCSRQEAAMKKTLALLLITALLFQLSSCTETPGGSARSDNPSNPSNPIAIKPHTDPAYAVSKVAEYKGPAAVPAYALESDLKNIFNLNQFRAGTDEQGDFYFAINILPDAAKYIERNGFVVLPSHKSTFYDTYETNRYNAVPSFITTDSVLHTFYLMYDYVLKDVERQTLDKTLKDLTSSMFRTSAEQYERLKGGNFANAARRNLAYFAVAYKLLFPNFEPPEEVAETVAQEMSLIEAANGIAPSPVVNLGSKAKSDTDLYQQDYSQFKVRGHYIFSEGMKRYFKANMWYGQVTFRAAVEDELKSSLLMAANTVKPEIKKMWQTIFNTINFFVGECDDITALDYESALREVYQGEMTEDKVTDSGKLSKAIKLINKLPPPAVNSVPIYKEEIQPDQVKAVKGFRFMGQRFTVDAAIFQKLMDRAVKGRMLPKGLDIPAALGSAEAEKILKQNFDVKKYPAYAANLKLCRDYMQNLKEDVWTSNLYWSWINMLRPLADNADRKGFPFFMQNDAWRRKELTTFLASWTELKYTTALYSKPPIAEMGGASAGNMPPPDDRGYVEPNPTLYKRMAALTRQTAAGLEALGLSTAELQTHFNKLNNIADRLGDIATKELANTPRSLEEYEFIRQYGAELEHFWKTAKKDEMDSLDLDPARFQEFHPDGVVADVATDPNGEVLQEATGFADNIVVAFPRDGKVVLGRGAVYSQFEFTVPLSQRMTINEWHKLLREASQTELNKYYAVWQDYVCTKENLVQ